MRSGGGVALALAAALVGCAGTAPPPREARTEAAVASADGPAPLAGEPLIELAVPGHRPAVVSVPVGATAPRPVIVAAHGAGDRPEHHCRMWRRTVAGRAFVLCPRGAPTNAYLAPEAMGFFYPTHHALGREITLALEALAARFSGRVDLTGPIFSGFSQGAIMGALILPQHPARFSRAVLIEGGYGLFQEWNVAVAQRWSRAGGARALLACGRAACATTARETSRWLGRGGVEAKVLHVEGVGHAYGGEMEDRVRAAFAWVTEGDDRWR